MQSCTIHKGSQLIIGEIPDKPQSNNCDHELLSLYLRVPLNPLATDQRQLKQSSRLKYNTSKLKEDVTRQKFKKELEHNSIGTLQAMRIAQTQYQNGLITRQQLVDNTNEMFTSNLHRVAGKVIGLCTNISSDSKNESTSRSKTPPRTTTDSPSQTRLKQQIQTQRQLLQKAYDKYENEQTVNTLYTNLNDTRKALRQDIKQNEDTKLHLFLVTGQLSLSLAGPTLNEAWACLKSLAFKISKHTADFPSRIFYNTNYKTDPATWSPSESVTPSDALGAQAWCQFRFALGHHRRKHYKSPFNEPEADLVEQETTRLQSVPISQQDSTADLALNREFKQEDLLRHLKKSPPDKSEGHDGISNRMLQSGGENFEQTLIHLLNLVWDTELYPESWCKALMRPIYKGGGKQRKDPASYRGIYLTCTTTKLFEGIISERLEEYISKHDTLTKFQFAKQGSQTHDAIHTLTSVIRNNQEHNKSSTYCAYIDFSTAYPSVHRERLTNILHEVGITGKIWRLLQVTYSKTKVRVLHPFIPEDGYTDILRGLPEGSRLSPLLFGIFLSELLRSLQRKYPTPTTRTYGTQGPLWLGAIAFVDDLVIITQCPQELQNMLHFIQAWCEGSRIEINTDKTKIVHHYPSLAPREERDREKNWHITKSFPQNANPQKIILKEVTTFKYLGVSLDQNLSMDPLTNQIIHSINAANSKLQNMIRDIKTSRELKTYHHSTLGRTSTSPLTLSQLWKSCVLIQATQFLRYVHSPAQLKRIQVSVNSSLQQTFNCQGNPVALLCELGIPSITIYRHKELVRLHYRLAESKPFSLPALLYGFRRHTSHEGHNYLQAPDTYILEDQVLISLKITFPTWRHPNTLPVPKYVTLKACTNKEKSFARALNKILSKVWRTELHQFAIDPPSSRMSAYLYLAKPDMARTSLFTPAQYLLLPTRVNVMAILRFRSQHAAEIPSHQHLGTKSGKIVFTPYRERTCSLCAQTHSTQVIGNEEHYLFYCPATKTKLSPQLITTLNRHLWYLGLPTWNKLSQEHRLQLTCASSPPTQWELPKKKQLQWAGRTLNHWAILAKQISKQLRT